jgi:hypothetical protein
MAATWQQHGSNMAAQESTHLTTRFGRPVIAKDAT